MLITHRNFNYYLIQPTRNILLYEPTDKLPKSNPSMIEGLVYSIKSFVASFTTNYAAVGKTTTDSTETIEVINW